MSEQLSPEEIEALQKWNTAPQWARGEYPIGEVPDLPKYDKVAEIAEYEKRSAPIKVLNFHIIGTIDDIIARLKKLRASLEMD